MSPRFVYDGTFEGFLSVLHHLLNNVEDPEEIQTSEKSAQHSLWMESIYIRSDIEHSKNMKERICNEISPEAFRHIYYAFLSDRDGVEMDILQYVNLGWELGENLIYQIADDRVRRIHNLSAKVRREKHRLLGFIRFRLLPDDLLYAEIAPDCDILPLVAPHFVNRMSHRRWIVHDRKRKKTALFVDGELKLLDEEIIRPQHVPKKEDPYQSLWKRYFRDIAIWERHNPRLQRSRMPKKYWNMLLEKEPDIGG